MLVVMIKNIKFYGKCFGRHIIFALFMAFFIEYLMNLDFYGLVNSGRNINAEQLYTIEDSDYINLNVNGESVCANKDDPIMVFPNINEYVEDIEIKYGNLSSSELSVQVFISNEGEAFTEENSVSVIATENKGCVYININQKVSDLRIDFGTLKGDRYDFKQLVVNPCFTTYLFGNLRNLSIVRIVIYTLVIFVSILAILDYRKFLEKLFTYRWAIGCGLIVMCTLCKLHGSSIGMIAQHLGADNTSLLWGTPRSILSDEYVVFTGRTLGQISSGFRWFSTLLGYSPNDMYLIYGQPVYDITTIFHPFSVGYLFLNAEYGMALYWSSRLIIGFLVSFEFGRIFTKDNKGLSVAYAFLVIFSPLVQWWCAINELVEMLIFGQLALIILHFYIRTISIKRKCIYMAGIVLSAGTYFMVLYPARMIPLFYAFLSFFIAMCIEDRKLIKIKREDIIIWVIGIITFALGVIYVFTRSGDTMMTLLNTVSPGKRMYYGGPIENIVELFRGWTSYIWTFVTTSNPCEEAGFINFYPLGIILSLIWMINNKKLDSWLISINIVNALLTVYLLFDLPEFIGTITLLGRATVRIFDAIGFINLILLFRMIVLMKDFSFKENILIPMATVFAIISLYGVNGLVDKGIVALVVIVTVVMTIIVVRCGKKKYQNVFIATTILLSIVGGGLVNPVSSGLDTIYDLQILQQIQEVNNEDEGMWVTDSFVFENLPTFVGAKTLNATETYPDRQLWTDLGFENQEEIWNRYLHTSVTITENDNYLDLLYVDHVMLYVTVDKLRDIGTKYILTSQLLDGYDGVERVCEANSKIIYKIN